MDHERDAKYLRIVVDPIRKCASYLPKFGRGGSTGLDLDSFRNLYSRDSFYSWFGLDNELMYAAHRAAGGMTSVYRQIGTGCERLVREIIKNECVLSEKQATWSYTVEKAGGGKRKLSLDARIRTDDVQDSDVKQRVREWMRSASGDVDDQLLESLHGVVFEIRQGYKSKDAKRQNADITNAASAYAKLYLPCVALLSSQIDEDIMLRYRNNRWVVLVGSTSSDDPTESTYEFMREIIGYDLAAFFERNSTTLRNEVRSVLESLLRP